MVCPKCSRNQSVVNRTWNVRVSAGEFRLRTRICKGCGTFYRTYELSFDEKTDASKIANLVSKAMRDFPPVIRASKEKELFPIW